MSVYGEKSFYKRTEINDRFLEFYNHTKMEPQGDDGYVEITHRWTNRPDLMALDLYGDSDFWYVIPMRNGFEDPYYDMTFNRTVVVPPKSYVELLFG